MRIKFSNSFDPHSDCPEEKLKNISFTEQIGRNRSLFPVTPERGKKDSWIMDPWQTTVDQIGFSPESKILNKHIDNYSTSRSHMKKRDLSSDQNEENPIFLTPQLNKNEERFPQKENKYRLRLCSQLKSQKSSKIEQIQEPCLYKKPISSILYPVVKNRDRDTNRRIDRFHSFVARNIRK